MHSSIASSSQKDEGPKRVPLPWVVTIMQIQFTISASSPRARSVSTEAVTVDAVDMLVEEDQKGQLMQLGYRAWDVRLRKILQLTTGSIKTQSPTSDLGAAKVFIFKEFKGYLSTIMIQNTKSTGN